MELLKRYLELQEQIYNFFGYKEDYVVIPLEDSTECYWYLDQDQDGRGYVSFSEEPLSIELISEGDEFYQDVIYTQRFLPKWVYRADNYTMICVDTRTDGNKFLRVFDNSKELSEPTIDQLWAIRKWYHL